MEHGLTEGYVVGGGESRGGVTLAAEAAGMNPRWAKERVPGGDPG